MALKTSDIRDITIDAFDYPLPDSRIAPHPVEPRDSCLLLCRDSHGALSTHIFSDLPSLLPPQALMVCNNTRVINARLRMHKPGPAGAAVEVFCLEPAAPRDYALNFASSSPVEWTCFVGNSKRWKAGQIQMEIPALDITLRAERISRLDDTSVVRLSWDRPEIPFATVIAAAGEIPVPPYLNRPTEASDSLDYQTLFSRIDGSVAAPTAGLHFTDRVLADLDARGIQRREVTLHVGAGTFRPVKSDTIGDHPMHAEMIVVSRQLIEELAANTRPIFAVGTTSVRTLESLYHMGRLAAEGRFEGSLPQWAPYAGDDIPAADALRALLRHIGDAPHLCASTRLMIAPGYRFKLVDGLITNFHQPRSTLLLLVSAFLGGGDQWRRTYDFALADPRYRFLSYGDACLFLPPAPSPLTSACPTSPHHS